ncbi:hypothetical protein HDU96_007552, partial [Phlyctochytrium bullatum]
TDASFAERLCDKLRSEVIEVGTPDAAIRDLRLAVFLDTQQLKAGQSYELQFLSALRRSCVVFPVVSEEGLELLREVREGDVDNVLAEWQLALKLMAKGEVDVVPILVGRRVDGGYRKFGAFNVSVFPEGVFVDPDDMNDKVQSIALRFATDVWPSYRHRWHDAAALAPEPMQLCVQCGDTFKQSLNVNGSCRYHCGIKGSMYQCCGSDMPCKAGEHRARHHNDYRYSKFYEWMFSIRGNESLYTTYASIEATDARTENEGALADCGHINPGYAANANEIFVYLWANADHFFFSTFDAEEVEKADPDVPIARMSAWPVVNHEFLGPGDPEDIDDDDEDEEDAVGSEKKNEAVVKQEPIRVEAWWIYEEGSVVGIKLFASTATCETPAITRCYFSYRDQTPSLRKVVVESRPLFGERRLPNPTDLGANYPTLPTGPLYLGPSSFALPLPRPPQALDAHTTRYGSCGLEAEVVSRSGFTPPMLGPLVDRFAAEIKLTSPLGARVEEEVVEVECRWRARDRRADGSEPEWTAVAVTAKVVDRKPFQAAVYEELPVKVGKGKSVAVAVTVDLKKEMPLASSWAPVLWNASKGPLLFEVIIRTKGGAMSVVLEYCISTQQEAFHGPARTPQTLTLFNVDDHQQLARQFVHVHRSPEPRHSASQGDFLLTNIRNMSFTIHSLREAVLKCEADPTLHNVVLLDETSPPTSWDCAGVAVHALVDRGCRRVYALQVEAYTVTSRAVDWVLVPEYGDPVAPEDVQAFVKTGKPVEVPERRAKMLHFEEGDDDESDVSLFFPWTAPPFFKQEMADFAPPPALEGYDAVAAEEAAPVEAAGLVDAGVAKRLSELEGRLAAMEKTLVSVDTRLTRILEKMDGATNASSVAAARSPGVIGFEDGHVPGSGTIDEKLDAMERRIASLPSIIHRTIESSLDSQAVVVSALVKAAIESRLTQFEDEIGNLRGASPDRRNRSDGNGGGASGGGGGGGGVSGVVGGAAAGAAEAIKTVVSVPGAIVSGVGTGLAAGVSGVFAVVSQAAGVKGSDSKRSSVTDADKTGDGKDKEAAGSGAPTAPGTPSSSADRSKGTQGKEGDAEKKPQKGKIWW